MFYGNTELFEVNSNKYFTGDTVEPRKLVGTVIRGEGFVFQYYLVEEGIYLVTITMLFYKVKGDNITTTSPVGICLSSFAFVAFESKHNVVNENKLICLSRNAASSLKLVPLASSQN